MVCSLAEGGGRHFEDLAANRQHCSPMPYVSAEATITCPRAERFLRRQLPPARCVSRDCLGEPCSWGAYPRSRDAGTHAGPTREMRGAGEAVHVAADFGLCLVKTLNPDVLMMESVQDWYRCDGAELLRAPKIRRILVQ
jgi:hypothetical protein